MRCGRLASAALGVVDGQFSSLCIHCIHEKKDSALPWLDQGSSWVVWYLACCECIAELSLVCSGVDELLERDSIESRPLERLGAGWSTGLPPSSGPAPECTNAAIAHECVSRVEPDDACPTQLRD